MPLNAREKELFASKSRDALYFREGAACEARLRAESYGVHRDLVECAEALAEHHQSLTSSEIALMLARIFNHVIEEDPI